MVKPGCLKVGDVVGVVAPSDAVERTSLEQSAKILEKWGLKVKFGQHLYSVIGDFMAGSAAERMADLKTMIADEEVKAIWCATGGYAATEVLPIFSRETVAYLRQRPKWFVGYSDVCMLLNALFSFKIASLMGPNLWGLPDWNKSSQELMRKLLFGEKVMGIGPEAKWRGVTVAFIVTTFQTLFSFWLRSIRVGN
jgi:muramoyltetrapeptide carboxypeptidase